MSRSPSEPARDDMEEEDITLDDEDSDFVDDQDALKNVTMSNADRIIRDTMAGFIVELNVQRLNTEFKKIKKIFPVLKKFGVLQPQFNAIFDVVMSGKLGRHNSLLLIPYLLPRSDIADEYIIRIIESISHKTKDLIVIGELLKWTIAVYDVINTKERIRRLYPVLFHYLPYETIRPYLCHLLYFLTKREHLTPYRIKRLNELIEQERDNAELIGLLLVYQTYDTTIEVPHNVRLVNVSVFQNPSPEIKNDLNNVLYLWDNEIEVTLDIHKAEFKLPTKRKAKSLTSKRARPQQTVSKLDVIDITRIANNVEDLELGEQLSTILENRKLQHILVCEPKETTIDRLSYWLTQNIMDLIRWNNSRDVGKQELHNLLILLVKFTQFSKSQLPVIEKFLFKYLKSWNGYEFENEIFELISFIKPGSFKDIYQFVLKPLYKLFIVSDVKWKSKLILCYTEWIKNWALLDWKGHVELSKEEDVDIDRLTTAFSGLSFDINYFGTIQKLVEHVDRICVMGLLAEEDHPLIQHAGLSFFELIATISLQDDIPDIIIPAATFVHRNFFAGSAMPVDRICGIIHKYKLAFEENDEKTEDWMSRHTPQYLDHFNMYMKDICNAVWRSLALKKGNDETVPFSLTDENIQQLEDICKSRDTDANVILSITHSAALAGFSKRFMNSLEDEQGVETRHQEPITSTYLRQLNETNGVSIGYLKYRVEYLDYLLMLGLRGVYDLLYACMGSLKKYKPNVDDLSSTTSL